MEIVFGVILSLTAAVVGVWQISTRERDRPIHGPKDDGTLGIPHLQRWSMPSRQPRLGSLRRNMPFIDLNRIVVLGVALLIGAALVLGGVFAWDTWQEHRTPDLANQLDEVASMHATATSFTDTAHRYEALNQALTAANALIAEQGEGPIDQVYFERRDAIQADLDQLAHAVRITALQPIGAIPQPAAGTNSRLLMAGGRLFLLSDAFYQVDVTSRTLVKLIEPGDQVNGVQVGKITGVTWREDGPLLTDASHAYVYNLSLGTWSVLDLGSTEQVPTPPTDIAGIDVYDFNLYALDKATGMVVKFEGGDYAFGADQWSNAVASPELKNAIDFLVNGSVYALLPDGKIIKLYLGEVESVISPSLVPPFDSPVAFGSGTSGKYIYVVNGSDGRVARLDQDGRLVQQFVIDAPEADLNHVMDFVVDEATGIAYFVSPAGLYTTQLAAPPAQEQQDTSDQESEEPDSTATP